MRISEETGFIEVCKQTLLVGLGGCWGRVNVVVTELHSDSPFLYSDHRWGPRGRALPEDRGEAGPSELNY